MSRIRFIIALAFLIAFWGYPASEARAQAAQPQDTSLNTSDKATQQPTP